MKVSEFSSPIMHYDPIARLIVIARRDPNTGQVSFQIPSERDVEQARENHTDAVQVFPAHGQSQAVAISGAAASTADTTSETSARAGAQSNPEGAGESSARAPAAPATTPQDGPGVGAARVSVFA
jgi:hypothetical protein